MSRDRGGFKGSPLSDGRSAKLNSSAQKAEPSRRPHHLNGEPPEALIISVRIVFLYNIVILAAIIEGGSLGT
jgi:hypothetical protein